MNKEVTEKGQKLIGVFGQQPTFSELTGKLEEMKAGFWTGRKSLDIALVPLMTCETSTGIIRVIKMFAGEFGSSWIKEQVHVLKSNDELGQAFEALVSINDDKLVTSALWPVKEDFPGQEVKYDLDPWGRILGIPWR